MVPAAGPAWQGTLDQRWRRDDAPLASRGDAGADAELAPVASVAQQRLVSTFIDALHEGACILDGSGCIAVANAAAERILGRSEVELRGRHIHDLAHGGGRGGRGGGNGGRASGGGNGAAGHVAAACPLTEALRTGRPTRRRREQLQHRDGRFISVVCATSPLALAESPVVLLTLHAVPERESQERQRAELDAVIEATGASVFVCDARGTIVRLNRRAAERFGAVSGDFMRPIGELLPFHELRRLDGSPLPEEERPMAQALRGVTRTDVRIVLHRSDTGQDSQMQVSFAPIIDATGAVCGGVTVVTDITRLVRLEQQKDEFLNIASHELRTPLTSLKILTQLTRRRLQKVGALEAEQCVRMERSIGRMEQLINELLDISRIQTGKLSLQRELCDCVALCTLVAEEQGALFERSITLHLPPSRVMVEVDAARIAIVLANLLANALKYSAPALPVSLTLHVADGWATVAVHDAGGGIPPEALPHLFERFYRVPGVQVQCGSAIGLGLGLYISREIVQRHGGRIWVESELGQGSTFTFRLPLAPQ
jgi:signal transduction histidine kinase